MHNILNKPGWEVIGPVGQDASARTYFRVEKNSAAAILMDCTADEQARQDIPVFADISAWLRKAGLCAPEVYEADSEAGFMLVEDLGDVTFSQALESGVPAETLYGLAAEVLAHLRAQTDRPPLPDFKGSTVDLGHRRVIDWYVPQVTGRRNEGDLAESYLAVWQDIEAGLPPCPQGFVHADFHMGNLMWLPGREGLMRCGILDFQGAMTGPQPYDLTNLLEDARLDVPGNLAAQILAQEDESFRAHFRVLATRFHCRVIGQFIQLALMKGKTGYLVHIPRLERYIREALHDPLLEELGRFFDGAGIDFDTGGFSTESLSRDIIRTDAF